MRANKEDLIGKKFGRLTVLEYDYTNKYHRSYWLCECECGNIKSIMRHSLISGRSNSCGCEVKNNSMKHDMSYTRFYNIWGDMKHRCYNLNNKHYNNYGSRGITVCEKWLCSFNNFKEDMYDSYVEHCEEFGISQTTIDRINNDGNYEPDNCRWATRKEQSNNTRINPGWYKKKELEANV